MTYIPPSGTAAYLTIAHLQTLPAATWITTRELADAIGRESDNVHGCLEKALKTGLVLRKRTPGGQTLWALGDPITLRKADPQWQPTPVPGYAPGHFLPNWPPGYTPHFRIETAQGGHTRVVELN